MDSWILELIFVGVMLVVLAALGPLIKRFGRAYAADVFRAPRLDRDASTTDHRIVDPGTFLRR